MAGHAVYTVYTNLDPLQLSEVASETFRAWLEFALGKRELGGKKIKHPTGRYASAISWRKTGVATVSVIADEDAIDEVGHIEYGHVATDMRSRMFWGGRARMSKDGHYYRVIPLRPDQWRKTPDLTPGMMIDTMTGGRLRRGVAKMWASPRPYVDKKSRFRTMTNRPGGARWTVPAFLPYAPAKHLADALDDAFGVTR